MQRPCCQWKSDDWRCPLDFSLKVRRLMNVKAVCRRMIRCFRPGGVGSPLPRLMTLCLVALAPVACGPSQDQSKISPIVIFQYCSGSVCGSSGSQDGSNQTFHVAPNLPIWVGVEGHSSLRGMKSLVLTPSYTFSCSQGNIGQSGVPDFIPPVTTTGGTGTLQLSLQQNWGPPNGHCQSGVPFASWSGFFTATAVSYNERSATAQLNLQSP
jgi:hypothetical protein